MSRFGTTMAACAAIATLSACGGGSTGGGVGDYASQFATLRAGDLATITPEVDLPTGAATYDYDGVASFNLSSGSSLIVYYGALAVDVSFSADTLSGQVTNLADINQDAVSGRVDITAGVLTGTNTGLGDGLSAIADGTIDGIDVSMDVTGHFFGDNGEGMALYFEEFGGSGIGVGIAAR